MDNRKDNSATVYEYDSSGGITLEQSWKENSGELSSGLGFCCSLFFVHLNLGQSTFASGVTFFAPIMLHLKNRNPPKSLNLCSEIQTPEQAISNPENANLEFKTVNTGNSNWTICTLCSASLSALH